jgi:hypothetical protein
MVKHGTYAVDAANACREMHVKEAVPALEYAWRTTRDFWTADECYRDSRFLRGLPEPKAVRAAFFRILAGAGTDSDIRTFLNFDPTYATMIALEGMHRPIKGDSLKFQARAAKMLLKLPKRTTRPLIVRLHIKDPQRLVDNYNRLHSKD